MSLGIAIEHEGRRVALKWHRLRRRMSEPLFGASNLAEGLRLGASMEIDLRVTQDFDFVVLHDETLDGETNGSGAVAERTAAELLGLAYDDAAVAGAPRHGRPLLLLDDLAAGLAGGHPAALLQFDMKDDLAAIGPKGVERLARKLGDARAPVIVSGDCPELMLALKTRLPDLAIGIEPSFRLIELFRKGDGKEAVAQLGAELAGPTRAAMVYLYWPMVLHALDRGIDLVAICHDAGKAVDAWTFTLADPDAGFSEREWRDFSRLLSLGVDQITTDEAIATERACAVRVVSG